MEDTLETMRLKRDFWRKNYFLTLFFFILFTIGSGYLFAKDLYEQELYKVQYEQCKSTKDICWDELKTVRNHCASIGKL